MTEVRSRRDGRDATTPALWAPAGRTRNSHLVLDFTRGSKGARRERIGLASDLAATLSPHFGRVTVLYPRLELPSDPCRIADVVAVDTRSDILCEEVILPLLLRRLRATHVFTFRESFVLPRGTYGHLHLHEDPSIRRTLERAARTAIDLKVAVLESRSAYRHARLLRSIHSLTTSSRWTLARVRDGTGARLPAVRDASVAYLGGLADSVACTPPFRREQRSHILISASRDPRDDLSWALRLYDAAAAELVDAPKAVLVGVSKIDAKLQRPDLECVGFVSDDALIGLYRTALAYIHPSSFEGFGLPIVEAMQCGTPTFAPTGSAVDEVAGDSAYDSPGAAARILLGILEHGDAWEAASADAWRRGRMYQWSRCAQEIATHMIPR
jgi:glycosyltransferase involved in cell wall biosynthesis